MTKPKAPLTTQKIHAALRKLGFAASKNQGASRIRGFPNRSPGYTVRDATGAIRVSWAGWDYTTPREKIIENVEALRCGLIGAGFECHLDGCDIVIPKGGGLTPCQPTE